MSRHSRTNKVAGAVFILMCAATYAVVNVPRIERHGASVSSTQVKEIAGYKQWAKVNAEPQLMPRRVAQLCAAPLTIGESVPDGADNPHRDKYFTVYINAAGRAAMLEQKTPVFPVGAVIVKEKLSAADNPSPELLTVMIKRQKDYNPTNGDWEYFVTDGAGKQIAARGNLQNCQQCHLARRATDYVFRSYLSAGEQSKLK